MIAQAPAPSFPLAASPPQESQAIQSRSGLEPLGLVLLWLTGASSALVFIEPSPYELFSLIALSLFLVAGLMFRATLIPLAVLLILINIGYTFSASELFGEPLVASWIVTSWYLAITALFFATALCNNTQARLDALMRGSVWAGIIASLIGIAAYFHAMPHADDFLLYDRARSTFKDPNVFGAFMVLPALLALQLVIAGRFWQATRGVMLLGLFAIAVLLSFSRAAWGQVVFAGAAVLLLTFITSRAPAQRVRIVLFTVAGVAAIALMLAALLSISAVAELMKQRMSLEQGYDMGETGRFGRHVLGALLAMDKPFGIGPMQFIKFFPEDPHNSYLNAFMSGGWLSGVCYFTLVLISLAYGLRALLVPTPWQPTLIVVYSAYAGTAFESAIIDSDHWRHDFLLLGALWGLIAATSTSDAKAALAPPEASS